MERQRLCSSISLFFRSNYIVFGFRPYGVTSLYPRKNLKKLMVSFLLTVMPNKCFEFSSLDMISLVIKTCYVKTATPPEACIFCIEDV